MVATMYAADGVGLAACQIGVDLAVFVFDCPDDDGERTVGRGLQPGGRRCPRAGTASSTRARRAACRSPARSSSARGRTSRRDRHRPRRRAGDVQGDGLLARCLQHETDHTLGTVFGDRLPTKAAKKLRKRMEAKAAEEYPPDWPA